MANSWQLGVNIGPDFYYGDLGPSNLLPNRNIHMAGSVLFGRQFSNVFGLRLQLLFGGLTGEKKSPSGGKDITQSFSGSVLEFNTNATVNFVNLFSPYKPSRRFFIYGTIGIGMTNWRTQKTTTSPDGVSSIDTPLQWKSAAVVPLGLGAYYSIGNRINLGLEWTFRMAFSDMVDQTQGGFKYDVYDYLAVGITIKLGKGGKKSMKMLDYSHPVIPTQIILPVQPETDYPRIAPPAIEESIPGDYLYSVQVCAFSKHRYSTNWVRKHYHLKQPVRMEKEGRMERFLIGNYKDIELARELCQSLIKQGIRDAFVVTYKDGVRLNR